MMSPEVFAEGAVYFAQRVGGSPLRCSICGHVIRTPEVFTVDDGGARHVWPQSPPLSVWARMRRWWDVPTVVRRSVDRRQAVLRDDPCRQRDPFDILWGA